MVPVKHTVEGADSTEERGQDRAGQRPNSGEALEESGYEEPDSIEIGSTRDSVLEFGRLGGTAVTIRRTLAVVGLFDLAVISIAHVSILSSRVGSGQPDLAGSIKIASKSQFTPRWEILQ